MSLKIKKGFTLIEIMIVIVIILLLLTMAIPELEKLLDSPQQDALTTIPVG